MRREWAGAFPLHPDLVMLNHASFGLPTRDLLARAEAIRVELDSDPTVTLGESLLERLDLVIATLADYLGLDPDHTALAPNATACAAAVQQSLPLTSQDVVVILDCEYSCVIRGWQHRCDQVGARARIVRVDLPLPDADTLLTAMTAAAGNDRVAVLQVSAVTSSAALRLPVSALAEWGHERGAVVVVDAAHAPGHVDVTWDGVDLGFGTVHKWLPVPRSVGILWAAPHLAHRIRPAEVSLSFDEARLARRFAWPGTFDPAPWLTVPDAIATHTSWNDTGELDRCTHLADHASDILTSLGAVPTAGPSLLPPRLRAFLLDGVPAPTLRQRLLNAGIRAWTGTHHDTATLLRIATNVYTDTADIDVLANEVMPLLNGRTTTP
jgi:isopenicillin-N epimerase